MFVWPNFQFVLSIVIVYGGLWGRSANINFAIKFVPNAYSAINRWILRNEESVSQLFSNPLAIFSNPTVCTLQSEQINKLMNFIRARFKLLPKHSYKIGVKSLLLFKTLEFFVFIITYWLRAIKIQNLKVFSKY